MNANLQEEWIKQITPLIFSQDELSLLGPTPPFPWEHFAVSIKDHFELPELTLLPQELCWRGSDRLLEGIGESPNTLCLTLSPLEGEVLWIMSSQDLWQLFAWVLGGNAASADILSENLQAGLYQFIALETLGALEKIGIFSGLSPQLTSSKDLPESPFLCLDIGIQAYHKTLWGRLCLSSTFRKAWKHFRRLNSEIPFFSTLGPKLELSIDVEVGQASFTVDEWLSAQPGDMILLESCTYDPDLKKGPVNLTFNNKQIFRGKLRNDHIKLNDYPLYFEELAPMDKDHPIQKQPEPDNDEDFPSFDDDEEDLFLEDAELAAVLAKELNPEGEAPEAEPDAAGPVEPPQPEEEKKVLTPMEIPLVVSVEIAHLRMTVQQLLELSPGNQLPLGKEPDNLVDLVVNGKCIGKGELIRVGETFGVRILQL